MGSVRPAKPPSDDEGTSNQNAEKDDCQTKRNAFICYEARNARPIGRRTRLNDGRQG
jgi:hypothetical protein